MTEFLSIATSPGVLPFSLLVIAVLCYWIVVAFGLVDLDSLDLDLDIDTDSTESADPKGGVLTGLLRFLNATDVPIFVVLSVIVIVTWVLAMLATILLAPVPIPFRESVIALSAFITAILVSKFITQPLRPLFLSLKEDEKADPIIGKSGIVRSHKLTDQRGQIEVTHRGTNALLNAKLSEGATPLNRGSEVIVFSHNPETGIYQVKPI